jgi:hypothetical protein
MRPAHVGSVVGFCVGKSGRPDKPRPRIINDLSSFCRKCQVFTTEGTRGELESIRPTNGLEWRSRTEVMC